ncbi:MAG: hypothetical protein BWY98_01081 [Tenericutes bacterium ADurb.BinA155]|nr:MAG: hypothetical protein BWY98_01081 [Tenericutes bacterium ADurb.BinA155]
MTPKIRKVKAVPIVGIVKKVGRNVPRIDPTVPKASKIPTTRPEVEPSFCAYLIKEGVTIPNKSSGGIKRMMHVKKEAQINNPEFTIMANKAVMPAITKRPRKGIKVIQVPESSMKK